MITGKAAVFLRSGTFPMTHPHHKTHDRCLHLSKLPSPTEIWDRAKVLLRALFPGRPRRGALERTAYYRLMVEHANEGIIVAQEGRIRYANPKAAALLGEADLRDRRFSGFIHPDDRDEVMDRYRRRTHGEDLSPVQAFRIRLPDGDHRWMAVNSVAIRWDGRPAVLSFFNDITERKAAEAELETHRHHLRELVDRRTAELKAANAHLQREIADRKRAETALRESRDKYENILKNIEEGYFEVDLAGNMTFFNEAMCRISGCAAEDLLGMNNREYTTSETARDMFRLFSRVYQTGRPVKIMDHEIIRRDGSTRVLEMSASLIRSPHGAPTGFRGIVRDVTERKKAEAELAHLAYHDSLTGLLNRKAFLERLQETLEHARRYRLRRAVLYIDLDRFKAVNDTHGHEAGDHLLREVARRLTETVRATDHIFRLGGDEFTVLLNDPDDPRPEAVAAHLVSAVSAPYDLDGILVDFITPSIGIGVYPRDGEDVDTLIRNADRAMYRAKAASARAPQPPAAGR